MQKPEHMVVVQNMNNTFVIKFFVLIPLLFTGLLNANEITDKTNQDFKLNFNTVTNEQWQQTLAGYKGTVLVVDMWATWCISCIERFPHMVQMNKDFKGKGVKFVSLLLEDPEEPEAIERAKGFLVKQQADFEHYFMNENLMSSFDKLDLLGIPAVFIYGADGELIHRLTGDNPNKQFTEKDIENAVNELLEN